MNGEQTLRKIKWLTWLFIVGLVVSGATAIPLEWELNVTAKLLGVANLSGSQAPNGFTHWILKVGEALHETNAGHPFMAYGTDWLAFGHFVIAIAFVGALRDPIRNRWLFTFGMIACVLVIPYALVFGAIRGIPIYWRLIDCSFGVFGFLPMWLCHRWARELELSNLNRRPEKN
jgi:hypothetical protein